MHRFLLIVLPLMFALALCPAHVIAQTDEQSGDVTQDTAQDDQPIERRNPRRVRQERGETGPPRMVAGGAGFGSGDNLQPYRKLEPIIGAFSFHGVQWRTPETKDTSEFAGVWQNSWELDGYYMRSEFRIESMRPEYVAMGLTWWDGAAKRFESHFYNSRSTLRTYRFGSFNEDGSQLDMKSRHSRKSEDEDPQSRYVIEIKSDDEFIYTGYQFRPDEGDWWKTFEITCTRVKSEEPVVEQPAEEENDDS